MASVINMRGGGNPPPTPPKDELDIIEALEDLLILAKDGLLLELLVVTRLENGQVDGDYYGEAEDPQKVLGEMTNLSLLYRDVYLNPLV